MSRRFLIHVALVWSVFVVAGVSSRPYCVYCTTRMGSVAGGSGVCVLDFPWRRDAAVYSGQGSEGVGAGVRRLRPSV